MTACCSCKVSEVQLASYFNDSNNIAAIAKIVHKDAWDLATLNTLSVSNCILEKKLRIVEELHKEGIMSKDNMKLFAYCFLKEGLEYAYPVHMRIHKKTVVHCDFEYILTTTQNLMSDKT